MATEPLIADPESDPAATWALDPARVRRLTRRVAASGAADTVTTTAPFTGAPLATLPRSTPEDVNAAFARARRAQAVWAERDVRDRIAVLLRVHDLVLSRQKELLDLVQLECGKARAHAYEEVADVAINARYYARVGRKMLAPTSHPGLVPVLTKVRELHHPVGVVGIISPWNYPLTLAISDALPALLAGNAVVVKPDSSTVLTALWCAEMLEDAGLPEDLYTIVVGEGPVVGTALIDNCDLVCFTGSTSTGRMVAQRAGARLVDASLELGGKNAMYIAEDADLPRAAEAAVRDCFSAAGQLCVSMERILLHERIADEFLDLFLDRVRRLRLGTELDFTSDIGCLISTAQLERVQEHVQDAVAVGARVLAGGRARPDIGPLFYEPTVLEGVPTTAACYADETFGPVVSVHRVSSDGEALALANDTLYGLNGSVWTRDLRRGEVLARQLHTGSVSVNEAYIATWGSVAAPLGGRKGSGLGHRHGRQGLERFVQSQTIAIQRGIGFGVLYAQGGERFSQLFTTALQVARKAGLPWP
jgi:succinate-semialdehyde dehydrogenase/glutarate-semialdehyde dehydrogenase